MILLDPRARAIRCRSRARRAYRSGAAARPRFGDEAPAPCNETPALTVQYMYMMWSTCKSACVALSCLCLFLTAGHPASAHTCIGEPRQHRLRANHPPGTALPELEKDCRGGLCLGQKNGPHWHDWHNGSGNASYPVGNPHDGFTHFSSTMVRVLLRCSARPATCTSEVT